MFFFIAQKDCGVEIRFSGIFRDGFHPKKGHLGGGGGETLRPGRNNLQFEATDLCLKSPGKDSMAIATPIWLIMAPKTIRNRTWEWLTIYFRYGVSTILGKRISGIWFVIPIWWAIWLNWLQKYLEWRKWMIMTLRNFIEYLARILHLQKWHPRSKNGNCGILKRVDP